MAQNIILVLADQHNAEWLGCAGHSQALTPHLDAFAAEATRFSQAYCANPICTPSRVSILSGQYCHNHGYYGLSGPSEAAPPSLLGHLRRHGYRSAAFGKLHLPCSPRNWIDDDVDEFGDAYETVDGIHGRSTYLNHLTSLGLRELEDSWHNPWNYGPKNIEEDARPSLLPYEHTLERWCVDQALRFIDQDRERPFCLQLAFQKPHHPLLPQQRFWDLYSADLALPGGHENLPSHRPPHFQAMWKRHRTIQWAYGAPDDAPEAGLRRAWRGTLACLSQIDDVFGILIQGLRARGLYDQTTVVYSSDHGAYHGLHGLAEKAPGICSNAVCRVPLIIREPRLADRGTVDEGLVELVDLAPTLCGLAGIPAMDTADGQDLSPRLADPALRGHRLAVTENPFSKAIRWGNWRLVHYTASTFPGQHEGELYNLERDPSETCNLFCDPAYQQVVNEGRCLLLDWLIETRRIVTNHAAVRRTEGSIATGDQRLSYPYQSADGKIAAILQPKHRKDNNICYL
jgi:arylsulfatase